MSNKETEALRNKINNILRKPIKINLLGKATTLNAINSQIKEIDNE